MNDSSNIATLNRHLDALRDVLAEFHTLGIDGVFSATAQIYGGPALVLDIRDFRKLMAGKAVQRIASADAVHWSATWNGVEIRACEPTPISEPCEVTL